MKYFAHSKGEDKANWQDLSEHLLNTSRLAFVLGEAAGVSEHARLAALLHDLGKFSVEFQRRLEGDPKKVDHSTAGAQQVMRLSDGQLAQNINATIIAYCIAAHHGGLPDYGHCSNSDQDPTLWVRLNRKKPQIIQIPESLISLFNLPLPSMPHLKTDRKNLGFSLAFFTRMVYSALVDADFLDTEAFIDANSTRAEFPSLAALRDQFFNKLHHLDKNGALNQKRAEIQAQCIQHSKDLPGYFKLSVPTGGGKTLSSMAFAFEHAFRYGLKRIIYVIPYTTIIEQNASVFKQFLGENVVLEHHSNFEWGFDDNVQNADDSTNDALRKLKKSAENWDVPVIVTTNVQFFESLFSRRPSRCRKLHNIAKSVIIFDEAHMLPSQFLQPCMQSVDELVKNYNCSVVFCTATQPPLERFISPGTEIREIISNPIDLYNSLKRVEIQPIGYITDDQIIKKIQQHDQVLCIVNTRRHASGLFQLLLNEEDSFHLSTLMCPKHRQKVVAEIHNRLKSQRPCRVISTQVMEAGVDLDFPVGYRALAGLDSIIQAAGRVNREGKRESGTLYVFEPQSEFVTKIPIYIAQGASASRLVLKTLGNTDPASLLSIQRYYEEMYTVQGPAAFDVKNILPIFSKEPPEFDFRTCDELFHLIQQNTASLVIPFDEQAFKIIDSVRHSDIPAKYSRALQTYTINLYQNEVQAIENLGAIEDIGGVFQCLKNLDLYDKKTGIRIPKMTGAQAIFCDS